MYKYKFNETEKDSISFFDEKNTLIQVADQLNQGHENYLPKIYQNVFSSSKDIANLAAQIVSDYMKTLDYPQIIRLSDCFRDYTSIEWFINWKDVDLKELKRTIDDEEEYLWVVRLGTFHPNGYFREKCICELENDPESIKYIILRYNDWAVPVRVKAVKACGGLCQNLSEDVFDMLPFLEKVYRSERRDDGDIRRLEDIISSKIYAILNASGWRNIKKLDGYNKWVLYRLLLRCERLNKDEIKDIMQKEKNGQCLREIVTVFFRKYHVYIDDLDDLLKSRSVFVKRKALEKKYELVKDYWDGLEKMLISPSKGVREIVSFILHHKTDIDIRSYYLTYLENADESEKAICILGIGENGVASDADYLMEFLDEESSRIVKSVLHAIGILCPKCVSEIYWKYLQDDRMNVMCQSYREIISHEISFGAERVYNLFCQTESILLKKKLANMLVRESCWDRMPYLLMLFWYEDDEIRERIRDGLKARSMYASISEKRAEWIQDILEEEKYHIPEKVKKDILFELKYVIN